jgi:DNA-binding CsgD family transcriptional regulator
VNQAPRPSIWQRLITWVSGQRSLVVEVRPGSLTDQVRSNWGALTPRQKEVVLLICEGYTNKQIADKLYISIATVKTHIRRIFAKFNLHSKAELRLLLSIKREESSPPFSKL